MTVTTSTTSPAPTRTAGPDPYSFDEGTGWWFDADGSRVGCQMPRIETFPRHQTEGAAEAALNLMRLARKTLAPWQEHVIRNGVGERTDGKFAAFEVCVEAPRQNGKNVIIEARELLSLYVLPDKTIIHSAHQFATARKSFRELEDLIRRTPALYKKVDGWRPGLKQKAKVRGIRTNGAEMSIELNDGSRIEYKARQNGQGRGFTGDLVVLDEAYDLDASDVGDMLPTMAARSMEGSPQVWYTSSAGKPNSFVLAKLRERGMSGDAGRLAYFEWSADEDSDSEDVDAWYQANPMLAIRISEEYVSDELDGMRTEADNPDVAAEQFRRERLGLYPNIGAGDAFLIAAYDRCLDVDSEPGSIYFMAVDVPPSRDVASVALVSGRPDGRVHAEIIDTVDVPMAADRLLELQTRWSPQAIVVDAGGAASTLVAECRKKGVKLKPISLKDYATACGGIFDAIKTATLAHLGQDELTEAIGAADMKVRERSLWTWARAKHSVSSISPLIALTLAWSAYAKRANRRSATGASTDGAPRRTGWRVGSR